MVLAISRRWHLRHAQTPPHKTLVPTTASAIITIMKESISMSFSIFEAEVDDLWSSSSDEAGVLTGGGFFTVGLAGFVLTGAIVGLEAGAAVLANFVGAAVFTAAGVGASVSLDVGLDVGLGVGLDVGLEVGLSVCLEVGLEVGLEVTSAMVGSEVVGGSVSTGPLAVAASCSPSAPSCSASVPAASVSVIDKSGAKACARR